MKFRLPGAALLALALGFASAAHAGVVNPDISLIGQPRIRWTDDPRSDARKRPALELGETELVIDADLNPYARGTAVFAFGDEGVDVEEAYFTMTRGLPAGLALKGGKYRTGFGKLNPTHPHTWPFADRFRVLGYLPGDEGLDEPAIQLSERVPVVGDFALTLSADWLQGDTFRIARDATTLAPNDPLNATDADDRAGEPRPGLLGRVSGFVGLGDRSGVEFGASGLQGTNNVAAATRTSVWGGDVKAKLWSGPDSYLLAQGEVLKLDREDAGWDETAAAYTKTHVRPIGGYLFADWNFSPRYDAGVSYERYQQANVARPWDQAFGAFAGLALMEETTSFRIGWERFMPGAPDGAPEPPAVNTVTLRVLFSMGPHKAHQF